MTNSNKNILIIFLIFLLTLLIIDYTYTSIKTTTIIKKYEKIVDLSSKRINQLEKENKRIKEEYTNFVNKYFMKKVTLTAYTNAKNETNFDNENTAIMETPYPGRSIAVSQDLSYLLGKKVYIEGIGVRIVNDLMNKRYTNSVDVLVPSKSYAKEFGVKKNKKLVLIE